MSRAMIVSDKRKILVRDDDPGRILTVIPTSKLVTYQGTDLIVMPHELDETRVLNNLGFDIQSPIETYYDWPSRYDNPMHAQSVTSGNLTMDFRHFLLSEIGTGKTLSVLWAFDYLRSVGAARCMLVVTPLSTMESVWANEVWEHLPHLSCQVLYGTAQRRVGQLEFPADIYVINHDGLKVPEIHAALMARTDIDVLCVDELADFKNASTDRFKALNKLGKGKKYFWGLTGTPIPNKVTDAWAQCRLISPDRVSPYFGRFKDLVTRQVSQFKWVPRDNALEIVRDAMQPATLFRRDECMDLPPTMWSNRHVEMSDDQKKAYKQMMATLVAEAGDGQIVAVNSAVKMGKLLQIAAACAYGPDGEVLHINAPGRIAEVRRIVEESEGKVIVFIPLTGALHSVANELSKEWKTEVVYGDVSLKERTRIFDEFKRPGGPHVIVAHPRCMSHGLTLVTANTIVWFIPTNNPNEYTQANGRITRPGQKRSTFIIHLEGSEVERRMYKALKEKGDVQNVLLNLIKDHANAT